MKDKNILNIEELEDILDENENTAHTLYNYKNSLDSWIKDYEENNAKLLPLYSNRFVSITKQANLIEQLLKEISVENDIIEQIIEKTKGDQ